MQLEAELAEGAWNVAAVEMEEVFETPERSWERLMKSEVEGLGCCRRWIRGGYRRIRV